MFQVKTLQKFAQCLTSPLTYLSQDGRLCRAEHLAKSIVTASTAAAQESNWRNLGSTLSRDPKLLHHPRIEQVLLDGLQKEVPIILREAQAIFSRTPNSSTVDRLEEIVKSAKARSDLSRFAYSVLMEIYRSATWPTEIPEIAQAARAAMNRQVAHVKEILAPADFTMFPEVKFMREGPESKLGHFPIRQVKLFGSRAPNLKLPGEDSDWDVLVEIACGEDDDSQIRDLLAVGNNLHPYSYMRTEWEQKVWTKLGGSEVVANLSASTAQILSLAFRRSISSRQIDLFLSVSNSSHTVRLPSCWPFGKSNCAPFLSLFPEGTPTCE